MALQPKSIIKEVQISDAQKKRILDFIQGAVYCWCQIKGDEEFSMRVLMGGDNRNWIGTPLYGLYSRHIENGKTAQKANDQAGKESGWLLKKMLHEDKRNFCSVGQKTYINTYKWIKPKSKLVTRIL